MRLDSNPQGGMMRTFVVAFSVAVLSSVYLAVAQQPAAPQPQQPMSFFITSAGSGKGADPGGLARADRTCQTLPTAPITRAATGRTAAPARRSSATTIARAAATRRGIQRTRAAAAVRKILSAPAAPDCSTALPSIDRVIGSGNWIIG